MYYQFDSKEPHTQKVTKRIMTKNKFVLKDKFVFEKLL